MCACPMCHTLGYTPWEEMGVGGQPVSSPAWHLKFSTHTRQSEAHFY
jgi:hypothetical protein